MKSLLIVGIYLSFLPSFVLSNEPSPYVGQEARSIKSMSPEKIENLRQGRGMGYAKTAELNHYPGPLHVLELAKELALSEEQKVQTQKIFDQMKVEAKKIGKQLIEHELALEKLFASGQVKSQTLEAHLNAIGKLEAHLRYTHLNAHIQQRTLLNKKQIQLYDKLRGYLVLDGHKKHHHSH